MKDSLLDPANLSNPELILFTLRQENKSLGSRKISDLTKLNLAITQQTLFRLKAKHCVLYSKGKYSISKLGLNLLGDLEHSLREANLSDDLSSGISSSGSLEVEDLIEKFRLFLEEGYLEKIHRKILEGVDFLEIDYSDLTSFDPEISEFLLKDPDNYLKIFEKALHNLSIDNKLSIRIFNLPKSQNFKISKLRQKQLNAFIAVEGIVRQASDVRPQAVSADFECPSCGHLITIPQLDTKFKEPSRCSCGRKGKFRLQSKELVDAQRIVLEESPESLESGGQPKRLPVLLRGSLTHPEQDSYSHLGSKIRLSGILREVPILLNTGVQSTRFDFVFEANNIFVCDQLDLSIPSDSDIKKFQSWVKKQNHLSNLFASFLPKIQGYSNLKKVMLCAFVDGGRGLLPPEKNDKIHFLVGGDTGVAKSDLGLSVKKFCKRSAYVLGTSTSRVGLSAAVVRDEFTGSFMLEAGTLPLCSSGICVIDELDKFFESETDSLHSAMSNAIVSIAKASVKSQLRANTGVFGFCNVPVYDAFSDPKFKPSLLARFDFVQVVADDVSSDKNIFGSMLDLDSPTVPYVESDLVKFVQYAHSLKVSFPKNLKSFLIDKALALRNNFSDLPRIRPTRRVIYSLLKISGGFAKFRLRETISKRDIEYSYAILCEMYGSFGLSLQNVVSENVVSEKVLK